MAYAADGWRDSPLVSFTREVLRNSFRFWLTFSLAQADSVGEEYFRNERLCAMAENLLSSKYSKPERGRPSGIVQKISDIVTTVHLLIVSDRIEGADQASRRRATAAH